MREQDQARRWRIRANKKGHKLCITIRHKKCPVFKGLGEALMIEP
jgi:hypothetical protein